LEQEKVDTGFPGSSPAVAPDESSLIFVCTNLDDGHEGDDLYISFQKKRQIMVGGKKYGKPDQFKQP
jgi:hypothetical protein